MKTLQGILGPLVTPFDDESGDVDIDGLVANIRAHLAAGLDGVVVTGSTGEAPLLDEDERRRMVEAAREVVPADKWLVVGTGAESTRLCARRSRDAAERGADAVLVVSPHYYTAAMTPDALAAHFERVADQSPCPVLLYNIRKYAHFALTPALVARLSRHENIVGMKDSDGDLSNLEGYLASQRDDFAVLTGHGGTFLSALERKARGGILAVALFAPELTLDVWRGFHEGALDTARDAQQRLVPLASEIVARLGVAGVKAAHDVIGLRGGSVRSPLLPIGADDEARVADLLRGAGVALAA